jgi:hypothetical protein
MELQQAQTVAAAADEAASQTVAAIETATELNDDPVVADALDDAAMNAVTTSGRVGWLSGMVGRLLAVRI